MRINLNILKLNSHLINVSLALKQKGLMLLLEAINDCVQTLYFSSNVGM